MPQVKQVSMGDQAPIVPTPMKDGEIRSVFLNLDQDMDFQANSFTSRVQPLTAQVNIEVGFRMPPHAITMASCLRDFTQVNTPIFFRSKADEDPQDFLDKVYNILFSMGVDP